MTHATARSKLCPLNKKYNRAEKDKQAAKKMALDGAARRAAARAAAQEDVPVTPPQPANVPVTPPQPPRQIYDEGENVTCRWKAGKWFLGQVTGFDNGLYTVYFLSGEVKRNVSPNHIRLSDSRYPRRHEMIDKDFFFDGAHDLAEGMWRVRQVLSDKNLYRCTRLTGAGPQNVENFDIGYVIKEYMKRMDERRELGLGKVLSTRMRRRACVGGE